VEPKQGTEPELELVVGITELVPSLVETILLESLSDDHRLPYLNVLLHWIWK